MTVNKTSNILSEKKDDNKISIADIEKDIDSVQAQNMIDRAIAVHQECIKKLESLKKPVSGAAWRRDNDPMFGKFIKRKGL